MLVVEWKLNLCQLYLLRSWAWSLSTDLARFSFPQRNFYSEERRRMNERCSERPDSGLLVVSAQHAAAVLNHHFLVETTASLSLLHWASHCLSPPHSMMLISVSFSLTSLRLLEHQLQTQRRTYDNEVESLRSELQNVKEENNRQQQLLAQNLQLPPEARIEASLQHEITRLTNENLVRCSPHIDTGRS